MNYIKLTGVSIIMMIFSLNLTAQTSIDRYFEQYQEDDRFSRVSVSSRMFNLFLELEADEPEEASLFEYHFQTDWIEGFNGRKK